MEYSETMFAAGKDNNEYIWMVTNLVFELRLVERTNGREDVVFDSIWDS